MENNGKKEWLINAFIVLLYLVSAFALYKLHVRELLWYPGPLGFYESDLPAHFNEGAAGTGYSLVEIGYWFIVHKLHMGFRAAAVFIIFLTLGTTYLTYRLMRKLKPDVNKYALHLLAFVCLYVMPIYLPMLNKYRYLGLQCGTVWHNTTYTGMRFAAMFVLIWYYGFQDRYMERFSWKDIVILTVLLSFVNMMKPNFIVCFAPAMALIILGDCFKTKGKYFGRQCLIALAVILSLVILVYEVVLLFPSGSSSDGSGLPIGFSLAYVLRLRADHPVISLLQSAAFPLIVLAANFRDLKENRFFRLTWLTWLIGLCEFLFIHENGYRKQDGNLSWGYSFCIYYVFLVSLAWFAKNIKDAFTEYQSSGQKGFVSWLWNSDRKRCVYLLAASVILTWHLICGIHYFILLCLGASYTI